MRMRQIHILVVQCHDYVLSVLFHELQVQVGSEFTIVNNTVSDFLELIFSWHYNCPIN